MTFEEYVKEELENTEELDDIYETTYDITLDIDYTTQE